MDTSAILAVAFGEPERAAFLEVLGRSPDILVSAVSAVEAKMVAHARRGEQAVWAVDQILGLERVAIESPSPAEVAVAHAAFVMFGKGSGHPARLNFGDLFSYALAKTRRLPLLYKGDDFGHTDIESALADRS